jgi:hypothetical protein
MIPFVTAPTILEVFVSYLFYGVEHGLLIPEPLNSGETDRETGNNKLQAPPDLKIGPNKFQITISKSQIRSKAICLGF